MLTLTLTDFYFWLAMRLPRRLVTCCIVRAWVESMQRGLNGETIMVKSMLEDWKEDDGIRH